MTRRTVALLLVCPMLSGCYLSHRLDPRGDGPDAGALIRDAGPPEDDGIIQLSVGESHACAVRSSGAVVCWGEGDEGQVGQGLGTDAEVPLLVPGLPPILRVAADMGHACAVSTEGAVFCWGRNEYGQITDRTAGGVIDYPLPELLEEEPAVDVAVGTRHTCVLRRDGLVGCRGSALEAQFAEGTGPTFGPITIDGIEPATQIEAHDKATCTRSSSGRVMCWGGLLGFDPTRRYRRTPAVLAVDALNVSVGRGDAIGLGEECAALTDGSVVCWQRSFLDVPIGTPSPARVPAIDDAVEVSVGHGYACARRGSGRVACWGRNFAGQLGDGTLEDAAEPRGVVGLDDAVAISAGASHACAVRRGGQLVCWGRNDRGQLGIASDVESSPVPVRLELP